MSRSTEQALLFAVFLCIRDGAEALLTGTGLGLRVALQAVRFRGGVDARRWASVVGVGGGR